MTENTGTNNYADSVHTIWGIFYIKKLVDLLHYIGNIMLKKGMAMWEVEKASVEECCMMHMCPRGNTC